MKSSEVSRLWPKFVFWGFIFVLSIGFGIQAIINSVQKIIDISNSDSVWDGIATFVVSILYLAEGFLFSFFVYLSFKSSFKLWRTIDQIREETGIKASRSQKKAEKKAKKEQKKYYKDSQDPENKY